MHSIRFKITALTVAAVLISILVLGGIGILAIGAESDRSSAEEMHLISEDTKRLLDAYGGRQGLLRSLREAGVSAIELRAIRHCPFLPP